MSSRESRMSSTTVAQFANELNRPAKELLELLRDAGVELSSVDDPITEADKAKLLTSLQRRAHGSRRITLTHRETRSEEHTSELQSRGHLVCRLLLEKKKKIDTHKAIDVLTDRYDLSII